MAALNPYLPDCTFQHVCHTSWVHKSKCEVTWVTTFWMVVHNIFGYSRYGICFILPIHHLEFLRWTPNFWKICAPLPYVLIMLFGSDFLQGQTLILKTVLLCLT